MLSQHPARNNAPEVTTVIVRLVGTGASAPTVAQPGLTGITVTRTGTGAYTLTFSEAQGTYLGHTEGWSADTPGDIAGHSTVVDTSGVTTTVVPLVVYNASDTAHDLAALEYLTLYIDFQNFS